MFNPLILLALLFAQAVYAQPAPAPAGELYLEIELRYTGYVADGDAVALYTLRSLLPDDGQRRPFFISRSECAQSPKLGLGDVFDINRPHFNAARRLWVDWDAGIIGLESADGQYFFVRYICLPKGLVDDLYLRDKKKSYSSKTRRKESPCEICYDKKRFFERLEKYGVTPTFKVPDTKPREAWDSNAWNKTIFIFPLDGKNE